MATCFGWWYLGQFWAEDSWKCEKTLMTVLVRDSENCEKSSKNWFILSLEGGLVDPGGGRGVDLEVVQC